MSVATAQSALEHPHEFALIDERQSIDWTSLDRILNQATNALLNACSGLEDRRLAVFAPNAVEVPIAHLAALQAGISSVPVNFHLTADELEYILRDSGSQLLFVGPETAQVGLAAAGRVGIAAVVGWRTPPMDGLTAWDDWLATGSVEAPAGERKPLPHLHYTSGTTGRPKGTLTPPTMFPPTDTEQFFDILRATWQAMGSPSPGLVVSPIYHTGPMGSIRMLGGGQALVLMSRFDAEQVLEAIDRYRVKATLMVPTHFQRLLALPQDVRDKYNVSSLQVVHHTGAACPRDVKAQMIDWFGPVFVEAYGATESGTTNMISSQDWLERPGSVGRTLAPFELMIISDEGELLGANQTGQIFFRDTSGRGIQFHNNAAQTLAAHRAPGVFTLGEVGHCDDDGYLYITDRVSDMIVSGGVNIYPAEVEQALQEHPEVADIAVIGVPNADFGEEVKALIVPRDPASPPSAAELDAYCRERIAGFKCPRTFEVRDDIGRNAMGKVNKRELRRPYWPSDRTIGG